MRNLDTNGQLYRLLEIDASEGMTKDADHAKRLHQLAADNYGLLAPELANYILKKGFTPEDLMVRLRELEQEVLQAKELAGADRIAERIALVLLTGELFQILVKPDSPTARRRNLVSLKVEEFVCRYIIRKYIASVCLKH